MGSQGPHGATKLTSCPEASRRAAASFGSCAPTARELAEELICLLSIPARLPAAMAAVSFLPPGVVMLLLLLLLLCELIPLLAPATSLTAMTLPGGAAGGREAAETAALQARRGSMCVVQ